jgi:cobalt-zinc-cadmium efflux system protein
MPDARGMIVFALLGIAVNGMAVLRLRGSAESLNARAVMLHLLEDVLGWVAVLVVSVVLLFRPIPILDPILSLVITLYVLYNVALNLRKTLSIFLQAVPENVDVKDVEGALQSLDGVESVHHTHVWSLDGEHHSLTAHVVVGASATREEVKSIKRACKRLLGSMHFTHQTIEIEYDDEECGASP